MADTNSFPFCCTGVILGGFGESGTAVVRSGSSSNRTEEGIKASIFDAARRNTRDAFICVTTNNEQTLLNKVLLDEGFSHSTWMTKRAHPNTRVRMWWIHIPTLLEKYCVGKES